MRLRPANTVTGETPPGKGRLEAFSDGVFAIVLTIMVLELKVPRAADATSLLEAWPLLLSYVISFTYVAVYWVNHQQLFHRVRAVDVRVLWSNMLLLFCLSLVPFFTEWMESTRLRPVPTAFYAGSLLSAAAAYYLLDRAVTRRSAGDGRAVLLRHAAQRKNIAAMAAYLAAIGLAFYRSVLSLALVFAVALLYAVPSIWVERCADTLESRESAVHPPGLT